MMFVCKGTLWLLTLLLLSGSIKSDEEPAWKENELSVGELIERANRGITHISGGLKLIERDIIVSESNADPCTSLNCMWPKSKDRKVYVPYVIDNVYNQTELQVIMKGLNSFSSVSCIRFTKRSNERDYIRIISGLGCYSNVGRQGNRQIVSLKRDVCIDHKIIQHELLHALGFDHEQSRSDRDNHIRIVWQNIEENMKDNFIKINTLNLGTPYDYNSVMQYERTAFSKNRKPTMVPIPNPNVPIGMATQMSNNDIIRIKKLYKC